MGKKSGKGVGKGSSSSKPATLSATLQIAGGVAAVAAAACVAAWIGPSGKAVPVESSVPICEWGTEYTTVAELLQRPTPCLVRGLEPAKHAEVARQWAPSTILRLPHARGQVSCRATEEPSHTRVMRYSNRNMQQPRKSFVSEHLGLSWPRERYDGWEFKANTMHDVLTPRDGTSASFSGNVEAFAGAHPSGAAAANAMAAALGPSKEAHEVVVWLASRGLGQQLHFDSSANIFIHMHGVLPHHTILTGPPSLPGHVSDPLLAIPGQARQALPAARGPSPQPPLPAAASGRAAVPAALEHRGFRSFSNRILHS